MQLQFKNFIKQHKLINTDEAILVAVSGGVDSMVMLHLFQEISNHHIVVAHCNFNLRGSESDSDEFLVKEYCKNNRLQFLTKSFDTIAFANDNGISIQMAARDLRYAWFHKIAKQHSLSKIAIAQHIDDQVETFFINLIRGTGISGIHGILPIKGNLIRPLLFADRKMIQEYQTKNNIPFREDESNKSDKYMRNFIRHNISPQFENLSQNFAFKLDENISRFREVEDFYKLTIQKNLKVVTTTINNNIIIDIEKLNSLDFIELHLRELMSDKGFSADTISKVYQQLYKPISGKSFESETYELLFNRKQVIIRKKKASVLSEYFINKDEIISTPINLQSELLENNISSYTTPSSIAYFDYEKLTFPLKLRKWKNADSFVPFGMKGRKKLSDYFIDNKVSNFEKADTWILLSGDEIIWIIGHRTDNRYRITKNAKHIYKITFDNGSN